MSNRREDGQRIMSCAGTDQGTTRERVQAECQYPSEYGRQIVDLVRLGRAPEVLARECVWSDNRDETVGGGPDP